MFRLTLLVVGKMKNRHLKALCDDFSGRLQRQAKLEIIELKDAGIDAESERILATIQARPEALVWAMAEEGRTMSSVSLAKEISQLQGRELLMVIGGPYGLSDAVKHQASRLIALSPMTFTHEMARYLLLEQLYRGVSIIAGSKYHHE
ncbi:23S rRNA (pseudouridine(1915)-N(3))-methyltransferase RlmH [Cerasicoccus fimbriatus]|uniref:23S rRNA (pseudouridine(1915)-N(3))-methyltransferase RlmH n=1 Tax=Cerasicoccus fimbriatus TaxID=3014554 RepID=UPI0022B4000D|nr:23S rRNA (pseudouridine(1915)-N(3))-methyltransferase RlmH [Cerasicoccus sp. TK19100]